MHGVERFTKENSENQDWPTPIIKCLCPKSDENCEKFIRNHVPVHVFMSTHTHTHTHIYIYIYFLCKHERYFDPIWSDSDNFHSHIADRNIETFTWMSTCSTLPIKTTRLHLTTSIDHLNPTSKTI